MNVSDFIFEYLRRRGVDVGFTVTGGGAMFLNEAHRNSAIKSIHCHHEQACAMAAVGYTKTNNKPSLVITTTGCGVTNAVTGLLDAYQDSVPVFFVSGNVNREQMTYFKNEYLGMRKLGMQEANAINIVRGLVNSCHVVSEAEQIGPIMVRAWEDMTVGRKGPVWLDVPLDIQNINLSDEYCKMWLNLSSPNNRLYDQTIDINELINNSKRPLLLIGNGVREYKKLLNSIKIPMVFTYLSADLLSSDSPLNIGRVGVKGDRAGNFAMQNCDLLLSIGCSLTTPVTGYNISQWCPNSKLVVVDLSMSQHHHLIDCGKLDKDNFIQADANGVLETLSKIDTVNPIWTDTTYTWKTKWSVFDENHDIPIENTVNIYTFLKKLGEVSHEICNDSIVVSDAGSAYYTTSQAFQFSSDQTYVTSGAQADMGFTLPAAIGAAIAGNERRVLAITGDGSLQMNIQELQTMWHHQLPITLFVLNNDGYLSIRNTMDKFFDSNYMGTDSSSGLSFPNLKDIAFAYKLKYFSITHIDDIEKSLFENGPCIVEVFCTPKQSIIPTTASKKNDDGSVTSQPLHNMFPFLSENELTHELIGV